MTFTRSVRAVEVDDETRELRVVASDESVDRYGDIIRAKGWDLKHFKNNPVLLFSHDSRSPPIGQVSKVKVEGTQLVATAKFLPEGTYDFADTIWRIVKAGALRAVSVGFLPTAEPVVIRDAHNDHITGFEFVGQELLELSVVPVPANPQALSLAKSFGLSEETTYRLFGGATERVASPTLPASASTERDPEEPTPQPGVRVMQGTHAFPRDLTMWESEKMRRTLRLKGTIR
jgi:HK97 family phage prohead protease